MYRDKISNILRHSEMLLGDCETFLYFRLDVASNPCGVGGGNWLQVLGNMAVMNLLAKINLINHIDESKHLSEEGCLVSERSAFAHLVNDKPRTILLNIENESVAEIKKIWDNFRNRLSHVGCFKYGSGAFVIDPYHGHHYTAVKQFIQDDDITLKAICKDPQGRSNHFAFYKLDNEWLCNSDVLTGKNRMIIEWLRGRILPDSPEEAAEFIYKSYIEK